MIPAGLRTTPFHACIEPLAVARKWERWAGYATVSYFYNVEQEYAAIRSTASLYDISPMIKYRVTGRDAARFVNRLITRDVDRIAPGRVIYAPWCDGAGRLVEDGTIFRFAANDFRINAAEHNLTWFEATARGLDVAIREVSEEVAGLSLQGPTARALLEAAGCRAAKDLRFFAIAESRLGNVPLTLTRTGFTGDLGFELWCAPDHAETLWARLAEAGRAYGLTPIGSAALDVARIEAGHIQVMSEYANARTAIAPRETRTPYELGLGWAVNFKKPHFNGRRALLAQSRAGGPKRRLVGLVVDDNRPARDSLVYDGRRRTVGEVTAATWSPTLKSSIALALVDAAYAEPGRELTVEVDFRRELSLERRTPKARVTGHRFFQPERQRA